MAAPLSDAPAAAQLLPPFLLRSVGPKAKAATAAAAAARRTGTRCAIGESRWHAPFREEKERVPCANKRRREMRIRYRMWGGLRDICGFKIPPFFVI